MPYLKKAIYACKRKKGDCIITDTSLIIMNLIIGLKKEAFAASYRKSAPRSFFF